MFLTPVLATAVVTSAGVLFFMGQASGEDASESVVESFLSDLEDVGDEELLEKMKEERMRRAQRSPKKVEGGQRPPDRPRSSRMIEAEEGNTASDEVDWELELADSEEVELTPEAIEASREYHRKNGLRLSVFGGPAGEAFNAEIHRRLARRRAEREGRRDQETLDSEESRSRVPRGTAGAGPG